MKSQEEDLLVPLLLTKCNTTIKEYGSITEATEQLAMVRCHTNYRSFKVLDVFHCCSCCFLLFVVNTLLSSITALVTRETKLQELSDC